jgi:HSP20 family molecular chaperone IbpA
MRCRLIRYRYTEVVREGSMVELWGSSRSLAPTRLQWRPPLDIYETAGELTVKVEAAGLSEEDFEITLYEDALVIEGVRSWPQSAEEVRFHAVEVQYGPFRIEVPVRIAIDRDRVSARYDLGFLYVTLPRTEAGR